MGQGEVLEVLEKYKEPISRKEIAEELDCDPVKVSKALALLLTSGDIKCIELDRYQTAKRLGLKSPRRRTRFYYI